MSGKIEWRNSHENKTFGRSVATTTKEGTEANKVEDVVKIRAVIGSLAALVLLVGQASAAPVRHSEQLVEVQSG